MLYVTIKENGFDNPECLSSRDVQPCQTIKYVLEHPKISANVVVISLDGGADMVYKNCPSETDIYIRDTQFLISIFGTSGIQLQTISVILHC